MRPSGGAHSSHEQPDAERSLVMDSVAEGRETMVRCWVVGWGAAVAAGRIALPVEADKAEVDDKLAVV